MTTSVQFEEIRKDWFKVTYYNGVYMGDITREHDLNYNFWPEYPSKGGFWSEDVLLGIGTKLAELNKPINEEYMAYFKAEEERDKSKDESFGF